MQYERRAQTPLSNWLPPTTHTLTAGQQNQRGDAVDGTNQTASTNLPLPCEGYCQGRVVLNSPLGLPVGLLGRRWIRRNAELDQEIFDASKQGHVRKKVILHHSHEPLRPERRPGVENLADAAAEAGRICRRTRTN